MSHRFVRTVAVAATLVLAIGGWTAAPASASDAQAPEQETTTTSLTDTGRQSRSIAPAAASRIFAQAHAQFGAFDSVFLPAAEGIPARAVVVSGFTGTVPMIDLPSGKATVFPITGLNGVMAVAATPGATSAHGRLFLVEPFSNNVAVFDIASHSFVADIPIPGAQPSALTFVGDASGETGTVFVGADVEDTIVGVDVATGETVTTIHDPRGSWIADIAPGADATPTSGSLLVLDEGLFGQVLRLDIATGAVLDTYQVFRPGDTGRRSISVIDGLDAGAETLLVTNQETGTAAKYDLATRSTLSEYHYRPSGGSRGLTSAAYVPGGPPGEGAVLTFLESGDFALFDEATGELVFEITSLGYPTGGVGFRASSEGSIEGEVFIADRLAGAIKVYDTVSGAVERQFNLSSTDYFPRLAMNGDASHLLAVGWEKGPVQVRDPDTGAVVRSVNLRASAIGAIPGSSEVLVSDASRKTLTLIDTLTGKAESPRTLDIAPGASTRGLWKGTSAYFVPDSVGTTVQVRSTEDFSLLQTLDGFRKPAFVALQGDRQLIVQEAGGVYRVVDLDTGEVTLAVRSGFRAAGVTAVVDHSTGGSRIYTADSTMGIGLTTVGGVSLTPDSLPDGLVDEPFEFELDAQGSPLPTLSLTGALPPGLALDLASGILSGTPTETGTFSFTVTASNGVSPDASREYSVTIGAVPALTTRTLPSATASEQYSAQIEAEGFPVPTYEVAEGSLPEGLSLDPATGVIGGTPTKPGVFTFTLRASNSFGADEREYTIELTSGALVPPPGGAGGGGDQGDAAAAMPSDGLLAVTGGLAPGVIAALGLLALVSGALSLGSRRNRARDAAHVLE